MINGQILKQAVISGANNISNQKNSINDLNIFPVPDGDTGTNMSMTVNAAVAALEDFDGTCAGDAAGITASAMLRGARGNSGVITSLIFRGFAQGLKDIEEVDGKNLAAALGIGVDAAYKAVMKPTEGTILTVAGAVSSSASIIMPFLITESIPSKITQRPLPPASTTPAFLSTGKS